MVLVERNLAPTRERAQGLISAGLVEVDGAVAKSAAQKTGENAQIRLLDRDHPWASRGGLKLEPALESFGVDCAGRVALDAGASTGGFTSVLLARGAELVYAVDVGHGQLITDVAGDSRVRVMDRTNIRTLESLDGPTPTLVTLDLSFISLRLVMPNLVRLAPGAEVVALFKPQFELGRDAVGKGGIVKDESLTAAGLRDFAAWCKAERIAEELHPPVASSVTGTKGNQEWLLHLRLAEA
jgi:23S rRNA (cytidine1920-2'-O)/16S rRNA (cytidine1409-2'-O)-methyltransferase